MIQVSVIIPSYNHACYIEEAVRSALNQSFTELEVIVVDDGSTDSTQRIIQEIEDTRLMYIYQENRGLPSARNTGIAQSRGEHVAFLDADDWFYPDKIEIQVRFLEANPEIGLVCGSWEIINSQGEWVAHAPWFVGRSSLDLKSFLYSCPFIPSAVFMRREWLEKIEGFDVQMRNIEDWDLWLRLSRAGCKMAWTPGAVSAYRVHEGNITSSLTKVRYYVFRVLEKFYATPDLPVSLGFTRNEVYANTCINLALAAYNKQELSQAQIDLKRAYQYEPAFVRRNLVNRIAWYTIDPTGNKPADKFIDDILENFPQEIEGIHINKNSILGESERILFFNAFQEGNTRSLICSYIKMIRHYPAHSFNRGVLSSLLRTLLRR